MKIEINENHSLIDLKKQFRAAYPYLKIEFFKQESSGDSNSGKSALYDSNTKLSEIQYVKGLPATLEFSDETSVHMFEEIFRKSHGLHVQVFRKSGPVYLETKNTDSWNLAQQNAEAKLSETNQGEDENRDLTDRDQWE